MKLQAHIDKTGLSIADYSEAVGVSHDTIRRALDGDFTAKTALMIFDYSDEKVKLQLPKIKYNAIKRKSL